MKNKRNIIAFPGADPNFVQMASDAVAAGDLDLAAEYFKQAFSQNVVKQNELGFQAFEAAVAETLTTGTEEEQVELINKLSQINIRKYIPVIKEYLVDNHHPILKTLLLLILIEQEVDEPMIVEKFGEEVSIIPADYTSPEESLFLLEIMHFIEARFSHKQPSIYEMAIDMISEHNLILFPLEVTDLEAWKVAYEIYLNRMFDLYSVVEVTEKVEEKLFIISKLEEAKPLHFM